MDMEKGWMHVGEDQHGFTMIELMLVVTVTLLIATMAFSTLDSTVLSGDTAQSVSETEENVRAGMSFLARDLIAAGAEIAVGGISVPVGFLPGGVFYSVMPFANRGPSINGMQTDRVMVIYNQLALQGLDVNQSAVAYKIYGVGGIDPNGLSITIDTTAPNPDASTVAPGDVLLVKTNGATAISALGYVTDKSVPATIYFTPGDPLNLNVAGAASKLGALSCQVAQDPGCVDTGVAFKVNIVQYFIDNSGANPVLMRQLNGQPPSQLALNIENLKLNYILRDGSSSPNPANPPNIRKAGIFIMGRSGRRGTLNKTYYRFPSSCQVATRNLAYNSSG
ncbi:MAG: prepilin-type N-terminal cleavage/methylation domain-containing protein [Acidobacteria bacterium]|nr:prepilin-type N-terminal cleavage/methylation domain-containing protein [Acidobacteriota bacterium]MBI3655957.1 prepilin-type N-terminal cleavage/methylation domain-containing protein [Acidobacteriota bacterium]